MDDRDQGPDRLDQQHTADLASQQPSSVPARSPSNSIGGDETAGRADASLPGTSDPVTLSARYEVHERLGGGGMGEVWRATDRILKRSVAIKRIKGQLAESRQGIARFLAEAQAVAALNHPNIVQVYDFGRDEQGHFLVMELVEGESLADRIRRCGPLPLAAVRELGASLCDALAAAHARGIVHRDIKPANILLASGGVVKLGDFGVARFEQDDSLRTSTAAVLGTWDYMAPEQRQDAHRADARSDLWSLAGTLYHALTGQVPRVIHPRRVPDALRDVLVRALEDDPADRFPSASAFGSALRASGTGCRPARRWLAGLALGKRVTHAAGVLVKVRRVGPAGLALAKRVTGVAGALVVRRRGEEDQDPPSPPRMAGNLASRLRLVRRYAVPALLALCVLVLTCLLLAPLLDHLVWWDDACVGALSTFLVALVLSAIFLLRKADPDGVPPRRRALFFWIGVFLWAVVVGGVVSLTADANHRASSARAHADRLRGAAEGSFYYNLQLREATDDEIGMRCGRAVLGFAGIAGLAFVVQLVRVVRDGRRKSVSIFNRGRYPAGGEAASPPQANGGPGEQLRRIQRPTVPALLALCGLVLTGLLFVPLLNRAMFWKDAAWGIIPSFVGGLVLSVIFLLRKTSPNGESPGRRALRFWCGAFLWAVVVGGAVSLTASANYFANCACGTERLLHEDRQGGKMLNDSTYFYGQAEDDSLGIACGCMVLGFAGIAGLAAVVQLIRVIRVRHEI